MAKIEGRGTLKAEVVLVLSEEEAGALDALAGYGDDSFIECFYKHMGRVYLEPYERGLRSLLKSVRTGEGCVSSILGRAQKARRIFYGEEK
jgi:hypothetical protein